MGFVQMKKEIENKMLQALVKYFERGEVFDSLKFVYNNLFKMYEGFEQYLIETEDYFEFNFATYYNELDHWVENKIRISNDFNDICLKMGYGSFNFYESYHTKGNITKKIDNLIPEFVNSKTEENYYTSNSR